MPYAIANAKWLLGPRDASDLISIVSFTFSMRRHLIRLTSATFTSFRLALFGFVLFADLRHSVCNTWQRSRTQNLHRVLKNPGPIFTRFWTKVHEILRQCRRPLVLSIIISLACLSTSRFVQKIFAIKCQSRRKPNKCKS